MPISLFVLVAVLVVIAAFACKYVVSKHIHGADAPEQTAKVTVIDKQAVDIPDAKPGEDDQEYWIYVQKGRFGPKREFKIGIHYYHALSPGHQGVLTYQGDKFMHFALKR
ncbi:RNA polymerase subunit sigma [Vibrio sp. UCD-FRSSP16_10]|uniref:DUF2500 domain-containing protein n=1 Tax=unclassified Vibrio TaxID=2614977 RepID=UPI00080055D4|nr:MULTISPECIES: DUF2500 domain-containing protein [unclassified Vibrio]OBT10193.1 RNA polymerase subunit sigma [Vibrio sp. UCD-FRSSP16_30]OBT18983.1 RNA polymerase subunit sigma [Vibrio sp. UCD-FRSSP16_10]